MEKKPSSVQLFAIALYEKGFLKGNGNDINDLLEEHKAMHKDEIEDAVNFGDEHGQITTYLTVEKYYNETFGGNNE
jgi:hypothetical protein